MKIRLILFFILVLHLNNCISQDAIENFSVDLSRFSGLWYEIASNVPEANICHCATDEFEFIPGRRFIKITSKCILFKDGLSVMQARRIKAFPCRNPNNSKFKLQSCWPFRRQYEIIALGKDYSWAAVLIPSKEALFILNRDSFIPAHYYSAILNTIRDRGYITAKIEKTPQNCDIIE
jgi:lipocalin